ncbi:hypothetical protein DSO57_1031849 [Entomophthora muscae]|uniref:Uncharacterized protein n=1 Tax=Entomophthora muscae TaxID=34485 RepID=A0ACC2TYU7_9FUNG|nr:hypothetical protein DSO57_1031849 [Entomophthora muscae]
MLLKSTVDYIALKALSEIKASSKPSGNGIKTANSKLKSASFSIQQLLKYAPQLDFDVLSTQISTAPLADVSEIVKPDDL